MDERNEEARGSWFPNSPSPPIPIDLTTRYRDRSRARNEAESDWRAESRTNGRNFGGRRVTASYGGAKIAGCLATRPFTIVDNTYVRTYIFGRGFHLAKCFGQNDTTNHRSITV